MRLPGSEKLEIIRLVEQSHLPARRTLEMLGIRPSTFYRWYDRYRAGGPEALEDKPSRPDRVWNRIPDDVRERIVAMALEVPELSPRELATRFTDSQGYFVSESSVYRLLKAHDLITSPAFIVIKAADEFKDKTTAPNQLWQTDFTYLKVIGWGWFYLSTILDDFSRYIIAWKLCTTMKAGDVTDTLQMALTASGCASARVAHKPRLLSDNGSRTCAVRPIIRRPRARSSAGIRRSRTASCSRTTTYPAISRRTSIASSITTITDATMRAWGT
jgi:putative transposase